MFIAMKIDIVNIAYNTIYGQTQRLTIIHDDARLLSCPPPIFSPACPSWRTAYRMVERSSYAFFLGILAEHAIQSPSVLMGNRRVKLIW
jgi:hypothetical protein